MTIAFDDKLPMGLFRAVLGFLDASECGADDAVFINNKQYVLEGSTFNIFAVAGRTIFTPNDDILMGVTRAKVIEHRAPCRILGR